MDAQINLKVSGFTGSPGMRASGTPLRKCDKYPFLIVWLISNTIHHVTLEVGTLLKPCSGEGI